MKNINKVDELFKLIESVKEENSCKKIRLLYGPKTEDFIASINFPDYVVLSCLNSDYINDKNIYILKDFEDDPPIKVIYEDPQYNDYINSLFKNM